MISIGIDIGGTSIKGAAVDSNGRVYETFSMPFIRGVGGVLGQGPLRIYYLKS